MAPLSYYKVAPNSNFVTVLLAMNFLSYSLLRIIYLYLLSTSSNHCAVHSGRRGGHNYFEILAFLAFLDILIFLMKEMKSRFAWNIDLPIKNQNSKFFVDVKMAKAWILWSKNGVFQVCKTLGAPRGTKIWYLWKCPQKCIFWYESSRSCWKLLELGQKTDQKSKF